MHILFLSGKDIYLNPIYQYLCEVEHKVTAVDHKITYSYCIQNNFDFVVSYNYKYLITADIIDLYPDRIINLHISYLPYNRGMHPNVWSWLLNTPKGVTIHKLDVGLDTGDILLQKRLDFNQTDLHKLTLESTYNTLQSEIQQLFIDNWYLLRTKQIVGTPQDHSLATHHYGKELKNVILTDSWNTTIHNLIFRNYLPISI
jgi:methionyl-tRNA formyltransferase